MSLSKRGICHKFLEEGSCPHGSNCIYKHIFTVNKYEAESCKDIMQKQCQAIIN